MLEVVGVSKYYGALAAIGGAAGPLGHGRSRRLAPPSPKRIRHGTPRALMGRLDGRWDVLVGALPHQRRARAATHSVQCGVGCPAEVPRDCSRFTRWPVRARRPAVPTWRCRSVSPDAVEIRIGPSRLDGRSGIFRTGSRLAAPRGASDGRSVRGSGPAEDPGRKASAHDDDGEIRAENVDEDSPCSSAGSTTSLFTARARYARRRAAR